MTIRSGRRLRSSAADQCAPRCGRTGGATAALALLSVLVGCSQLLPRWGGEIEVELIAARPEAPLDRFTVGHLFVVPTGDGSATESWIGAAQESLRLKIEKRTNLPILDYPLMAGRCDLLRPAGALYPLDLEEHGRLRMSYREGFLAELLFPVAAAGSLLEAVNVRRLRREIWERSAGDPWRLDRDAILQTLLFGVMRSDRIRRRPSFDVSFEAGAGSWICGDPFYGPSSVEPGQALLTLRGLPVGTHHFFRVAGDAIERIDVELTGEGWEWMDAFTGDTGSGRW